MAEQLEWVAVSEQMPPERFYLGTMMSSNVEVLMSDGTIQDDFTIEGKWTYYCEKIPDAPYPTAWRSPQQ